MATERGGGAVTENAMAQVSPLESPLESPQRSSWRQSPRVQAAAVVVLALIAHGRAFGHQFLYFDDNFFVFENAYVREGLTARTVSWALTDTWGFWFPVTRLSHLLDAQLFGMNPAGHHATNVLLHVATAWLLYEALRRLTGRPLPSWIVALVFAVHPVHVETVAWLSERKEVLCAFFFVAMLRAYAAYAAKPGLARMVAVHVLLALALMAKPMAVTAPAVLLLIDAWPLRRLLRDGRVAWRVVGEKVPMVLLVGGFSWLAHAAQRGIAATADPAIFPLGVRVANALVSYVKYLWMMAVPAKLSPFYPHPYDTLSSWQLVGGAALLLAVTATAVALRRRFPALLMGWLWWGGMFVPVIGLVQIGRQGLADHYAYLPSIGLTIAVVFTLAEGLQPWVRWRTLAVGVAAWLLALTALSVRQHGPWSDTETLFAYAAETNPPNWLAESTLASMRQRAGDRPGALEHRRRAVEFLSRDPQARAYERVLLASTLESLGRGEEALGELREAAREYPASARTQRPLADALARRGDFAGAAQAFERAVAAAPDDLEANYGLGASLLRSGDSARAREALERAAALGPERPGIWLALGEARLRLRDRAGARAAVERAIALQPKAPELRRAIEALRRRVEAAPPP